MKNGLLMTTALVAAMSAGTAYAGDVSLGLGGFINSGVGFGGDRFGADVQKDFHIIYDGEVHFNGKGTLDNGIQIITRIELEAHNNSDQIDEQWIQIKSQFGTVMIGGNDDAAYAIARQGLMDTGICAGAWDPCYNFTPTNIGEIGGMDSMGIHYYTPKIAGFEAGISWQPTLVEYANTQDTGSSTANSRDRISVGAEYSNSFGDIDFGISGGYIHTDAATGKIDETAYSLGAGVGFSGVRVEGRWEHIDDSGHVSGTEVDRFGGGISYKTGPWTFAAAAAYQDIDATGTAGDSELTRASVGAKYELGAGVNLAGIVMYGDVDNGAGGGKDEDGFGGALLLGVAF